MKTKNNLLPAIIIALGLIISSFIYAYSNRYELVNGGIARVDKWTNTIKVVQR